MKTFLSPKEAARVLSVHVNTVYALLHSGTLAATKFGGQWRIHRDAVKDLRNLFLERDEAGECVDVSAAAEMLGLHTNTVYKMLRNGTLAGAKVRGIWKVSKQVLERSMTLRVSDPTSFLHVAAVDASRVISGVMSYAEPFVVADQAAKRTVCLNELCMALSGYPESWFRKNEYMDLIHPDDREKYLDSESQLRALYLEDPTRFPLEVTDRIRVIDINGRARWVGYRAVIVFIGNRMLSSSVCWED